MSETRTQAEVAKDLAAFLTTKAGGYGYDRGKSPLDQTLETMIVKMTREIAAEVIEATPELAAHVRAKVQQTVAMSLRDDTWLNSVVVDAVAKAITGLATERSRESSTDE